MSRDGSGAGLSLPHADRRSALRQALPRSPIEIARHLNPTPSAPAGAGAREPAGTPASTAPATDARLQQKVYLHAVNQRLSDLLAWLSKATGVTLLAHMEVADERISYWAEDRPLMDAMRDLRHLHGYYWSRAKRGGQYVYSLWEDAQSRAREEAEIQRLAMKLQREFAESVQRHVRALGWSEDELKRAAQDDPYLVAQMLHPVVRAGYQLFAALSPDQQAQLLQGQAPSRRPPVGIPLSVLPLESFSVSSTSHPGQTEVLFSQPGMAAMSAPQGDVVTLEWAEMNAVQRSAVEAMFRGGQIQEEKAARQQPPSPYGNPYDNFIRALKTANMESAVVSMFSGGQPGQQAMGLRVAFQSEGRRWALDSNIAGPADADRGYNDLIRKGEFRLWPGASEDLRPYLAAGRKNRDDSRHPSGTPPSAYPPDPILDAPVTLDWALPIRGGRPGLFSDELLAALQREIRRPLVLDAGYPILNLPRGAPAEFRWQRRPLRGLLQQFAPGWECASSGGAIFLRNPDRLRDRLNQVPPAVERFLQERKVPFTLDDMALLARSLTPWQIAGLPLPPAAIDEALAADELLKLYGELVPTQRTALAEGLAFSSLTPPQQFLFLQLAQRQRPFVEPWRFQHGAIRLRSQPVPPRQPYMSSSEWPVARMLFQVQLQDEDSQVFPVDLFAPREETGWNSPPSHWIGKPFPFSLPSPAPEMDQEINPGWKPALADPRLRHRAAVVLFSRPFAHPYASIKPPPSATTMAQVLSRRLRDTGVVVVQVTLGAVAESHPSRIPLAQRTQSDPHLIALREPGDTNGQPFDSVSSGARIDQSPTVFVVDHDEIVRAVFEGQAAWDTAVIEAAERRIARLASHKAVSTRLQ